MKREPEGIRRRPAAVRDADRRYMLGAIAVGDLTIVVAPDHRRRCRGLAEGGCYASQGETTGQRGTAFQKIPSSRSFRTHRSLLRRWPAWQPFLRRQKYTPVPGAIE